MTPSNIDLDISVCIVSRNASNVNRVLASLLGSNFRGKMEVLISWNGPEDFPNLIEPFPSLNVSIHRDDPYHFSGNQNRIAEKAIGKSLLILNDDIVLDENCIQEAWLELGNEYVGIVGANLRYPTNQIQHAGLLFNEEGLPFHRFKNVLPYDHKKVANSSFVPAVTGAFMLIDRQEFLKIKFDESFLVSGEDVKLCIDYRTRFDKDILYCATATALHVENDTRKHHNQRLTPQEDKDLIKSTWKEFIEADKQEPKLYPRINIVTEVEGWIMHRKALEISRYVGKNVSINGNEGNYDIHYYINYGMMKKRPDNGVVVCNFTHFDEKSLADEFVSAANDCDFCVSVSQQTTRKLLEIGIPSSKIKTILVGADLEFEPQLTLGVVGRIYPGGRKGEHLVHELIADQNLMNGLKIMSLNHGWGVDVLHNVAHKDFYNLIDFLLVPSLVEGGPVPFMEALACGTLSIAPNVGVVEEFPHIPYEKGNIESMKSVIRELKNSHVSLKSRFSRMMKNHNWSSWGHEHLVLFRALMQK